jgi:hypothetical protein
MKNTEWTYEEFHAFVMLFAANADSNITADEEVLIAPTITPDRYLRVKELFRQCSDAKALDVIMSYREKYCATPAEKERILADMRAIFEAHHDFEQIEREMHHMFERRLK